MLSIIEIQAIADEVVRQIKPLIRGLSPVEIIAQLSSAEVEIARVKSMGLDQGEYLRQRAKNSREREKKKNPGRRRIYAKS